MEISEIELHQTFVQYGATAKEWLRKCALLLPEIHRRRIWEKKGFGSIYEYAGKLAGMSKSAVEEALWVVGRVEDKPELLRVIEKKGVGAVRPVASIATIETAEFWAEKASLMSIHTLQTYVHEAKREGLKDLPDVRQIQSETIDITMQLPRGMGERLMKIKGGREWGEVMNELLSLQEREREQNMPEEKITDSRYIPVEIEKFVIKRSGGVCEFGACRRRYDILHHIQRFALEHVHDPARIVALCTAHERIVHLGLVEDETILPRQWKIVSKADSNDPRYRVDVLVQQYRKMAR